MTYMTRPGEHLHIINNSAQNHAYKQMNSQKDRQEAHGPHRSPEKTVQINKHI